MKREGNKNSYIHGGYLHVSTICVASSCLDLMLLPETRSVLESPRRNNNFVKVNVSRKVSQYEHHTRHLITLESSTIPSPWVYSSLSLLLSIWLEKRVILASQNQRRIYLLSGMVFEL